MRTRRDAATVALLTLGIFLFYVAFLPPRIYSIDGMSMFQVAVSMLTRGTFEVSPSVVAAQGRDGLYYSMCWPLSSVLALAPLSIAMRAAQHFHLDAMRSAEIAVLFFSPAFTALSAGLIAAVSLRMEARISAAITAAVCFAFGTIALVYTRDYFAEPLVTALTLWGISAQLEPSSTGVVAGAISGVGVLAKPPAIVLGPLFSLHAALQRRRTRAIMLPLIGAAAGLGLYFLYNQYRFASPTSFGQPYHLRLRNIPGGVMGLLASPGRGLIWYSPAVLAIAGLGRGRLRNPDVLMILGVAAGYFGIYTMWDGWWGGWCWGPRLLMPAIAVLMTLGALLEGGWMRAMVALSGAGFLVNAPTLVSSYFNIFREQMAAGLDPNSFLWSFSRMPMFEVWRTAHEELAGAPALNARFSHPAPAGSLPMVEGVWWWKLAESGTPPWVGLAISSLLVGASLLLVAAAFGRARAASLSSSRQGCDTASAA